ncbi:MAG TPA: DUF4177 domain-containing protein [Rhodanobacteraceae bacterium]|jgi:hypothetical protein|nr:DUF4177 domain-containing protein [Rhodanobacteraceae bacterium]
MSIAQNWQYKVIQVKTDMWGRENADVLQATLNEAGREGWELVSTLQPYGAHIASLFLKRPS